MVHLDLVNQAYFAAYFSLDFFAEMSDGITKYEDSYICNTSVGIS